jgi:hypothetical protein
MNKEDVNANVSELKNVLVGHISSSTFSSATFAVPARTGKNPATIDAYVQAVLTGLGLPTPVACGKGSRAESAAAAAEAELRANAEAAAAASGAAAAPEEEVAEEAELGSASGARSSANSAASAASSQAGGALLLPNMAWVIEQILVKSHTNSDYLVHNGKQVLRVSCSEEMAKRFCAPIYMNYIGIKVESVCEAMTLDTYKHIPGGLEDSYISSLGLDSPAAKAVFKKWDDRVKSILDALASAGLPATGAAFPNPLTKPVVQSVTVLSGVNPMVRDAVYAANAPGAIARMVQPQMFTVGYAKPVMTAMYGGAVRNPHAPLYPKLVMNGGASPFALYGGNEAVKTMVKVIQNRIDALKTEYLAVSGEPLASEIDTQISGYVTKVSDGFTGLENDLKDLRDANGYLAQYPLSEGLPRPADAAGLKSLADKGRSVTEKSLKLSKQVGKLSDIENLLSELVANARPKKTSY